MRTCFRCAGHLADGQHAYRLHVELTADFDGYIDGDAVTPDSAFAAMTIAAGRCEEQLADEVRRERELILCPACAEPLWIDVTSPRPRQ